MTSFWVEWRVMESQIGAVAKSQGPTCPGFLRGQGGLSGKVIFELRPERWEGATLEKARRVSQEAGTASVKALW